MTLGSKRTLWHQDFVRRHRFEAAARKTFPDLRCRRAGSGQDACMLYTVVLPVPEYPDRLVELSFSTRTVEPQLLRVYADGPVSSPHRYAPRRRDPRERPSLCMWDPDGPEDERWTPRQHLLCLLEITRMHIFKEDYYREHGEWVGDELLHPLANG